MTWADREDNRAWGQKDKDGRTRSRMGVRNKSEPYAARYLRAAPTGAMTRERAAMYAREIDDCLERYREHFTRSEQSALYARRKVWRRRAEGLDPRFEAMGGVFGGSPTKYLPKTGRYVLGEMRAMVDRETEPPLYARPRPGMFDFLPKPDGESQTAKVARHSAGVGDINALEISQPAPAPKVRKKYTRKWRVGDFPVMDGGGEYLVEKCARVLKNLGPK